MTDTKRFSKSRLVEQLQKKSVELMVEGRFDPGNGTAQLRPRGWNDETQALIDKAVAYGRWRAYQEVAEQVQSGYLGT